MASAAGEIRGWALLALGAALAAAPPVGCAPNQSGDDANAAIGLTLQDAGSRVVLPALAALRDRAAELADAARAAADTPDDDAALAAARSAWWEAMEAWQVVEVYQIGPIADPLTATGGEDLRSAFSIWPDTNPCRVDQETVAARWDAPTFFTDTLPNVHGLAAMESLLFATGSQNHCPPQVDINETGAWAALSDADLRSNRASYAAALALELSRDAAALHETWSPDGGDWVGHLARPGAGASPYASDQDALQAVFDALFFSMAHIVRVKLNEPMGLGACSVDCAGKAESALAGGSTAWLKVNLGAVRDLLDGGDGFGLLDLAEAIGRTDARDLVITALDDADAAAARVDLPVPDAIADDADDLLALRDALERLKERIENDLRMALTLRIPSETAGDND